MRPGTQSRAPQPLPLSGSRRTRHQATLRPPAPARKKACPNRKTAPLSRVCLFERLLMRSRRRPGKLSLRPPKRRSKKRATVRRIAELDGMRKENAAAEMRLSVAFESGLSMRGMRFFKQTLKTRRTLDLMIMTQKYLSFALCKAIGNKYFFPAFFCSGHAKSARLFTCDVEIQHLNPAVLHRQIHIKGNAT